MLAVRRLAISDLVVLTPTRHADERGWFVESYNQARFEAAGVTHRFVQDNQAYSRAKGTIRGLHFQIAPFQQAKLVRVLRGSVFDVAVDLRRGSPTYGRWASIVLTAAEGEQLLVPPGFAHGYCTLEPDTEVFYKVDRPYSAQHDLGVRWNDPAIGIEWPVTAEQAVVSPRDAGQPLLADLPGYFSYDESRG